MVDFLIDRPIFATSIAILMVLAGLIAYRLLPVEQFPDVVPPQVQVTSSYPGASAQVVADTVTTPLEEQINGVEGMIYSSSVSANDGSSTITVTFNVGYPVDIAAVDTENRITAATGQLPPIVNQSGITVQKVNPNFTMIVNLFSPNGALSLPTISNYAYLQIVDVLKRLAGVSNVLIFGERRYAIRVWLNPSKLARFGLTATDVKNAILEQNQQVAAGKFGEAPAPAGTAFDYQVNTRGQLLDARQFGNIVLRAGTATSGTVYLRDVARTDLGSMQYSESAFLNQQPAVMLAVFQSPSANAMAVDREVRSAMARLAGRFPPGLRWSVSYDTTTFVAASLSEVTITLLIALVLVIAVVYLFLQSWRATIIPAIAIPVSLIATFAVMYVIGFSINTLSMLGMVLAIGLVVDDAIVVVENVQRQLENGLAPKAAAKKAMSEVTGPIIATSAVLAAVFVPIAFVPGITGRLYNQFAVTIAVSVAFSAFNSLTLSPALCAVLLTRETTSRFFLFHRFNQGFEAARSAYAAAVPRLVRHRWVALGVFAVGLGVTYLLFRTVPGAFLPNEDNGYFFVITSLPSGASLERTDAVMAEERRIVEAAPGVRSVISISGFNFVTRSTNSYSGAMFVMLKPWDERGGRLSAANIIASLRPKLARITQANVFALLPPAIRGIGTFGGFDLELEDRAGSGSDALADATRNFLALARRQPAIDGASLLSSFNTNTPELDFNLDRDKAKQLGVNLSDVFDTLHIYLGSLYVNNVTLFGRTFQVLLQADERARATKSELSALYTRNASGGMVPLDTLGSLSPTVGPETVPHYNMYEAAEITGSAAPGYSSAQAMAAVERAARSLPSGFGIEWTGITYQELKAAGVEGLVFALSLLFVFLFLAAQYESWTMPFMIILTVPLALFGALGLLWLRGIDKNVYVQIGFVMLVGLAAKNAILLVEFARRRREAGLGIVAAARAAARLRVRPILMTAFAFILGAAPLMFASGAGAASRRSIGTTVVGGMLAATMLSLGFVPIFYVVIEGIRERFWGATVPSASSSGESTPARDPTAPAHERGPRHDE